MKKEKCSELFIFSFPCQDNFPEFCLTTAHQAFSFPVNFFQVLEENLKTQKWSLHKLHHTEGHIGFFRPAGGTAAAPQVFSPPSPAPLRPPGPRLRAAVAASPAAAAAYVRAGRSSGGTACALRTSGESHPRSSSARSRMRRSAQERWRLNTGDKDFRWFTDKQHLTRAGMSFSSIREMKARLSAPSFADRS